MNTSRSIVRLSSGRSRLQRSVRKFVYSRFEIFTCRGSKARRIDRFEGKGIRHESSKVPLGISICWGRGARFRILSSKLSSNVEEINTCLYLVKFLNRQNEKPTKNKRDCFPVSSDS